MSVGGIPPFSLIGTRFGTLIWLSSLTNSMRYPNVSGSKVGFYYSHAIFFAEVLRYRFSVTTFHLSVLLQAAVRMGMSCGSPGLLSFSVVF